MKKVLAFIVAAGILATTSFTSAATIVGSKHDLAASGTAAQSGTGSSTQICVYCHAPHNSNFSLPLWNRVNPEGSLFTLYSGVGMSNVSFKTGFTADSTSLFCMSCHDGVTAIGAVYNAGAIAGFGGSVVGAIHTAPANTFSSQGAALPAGPTSLSQNLSKTHPVNFPVTQNPTGDLNLGNTATNLMGPGTPNAKIAVFTVTFPLFRSSNGGGVRDTGNRSLECGSCHAVHDSANSPFLRDTMTNSMLCLGCHNK